MKAKDLAKEINGLGTDEEKLSCMKNAILDGFKSRIKCRKPQYNSAFLAIRDEVHNWYRTVLKHLEGPKLFKDDAVLDYWDILRRKAEEKEASRDNKNELSKPQESTT